MSLLDELEKEFGIASQKSKIEPPIYNANIFKHKWTLRRLSWGDFERVNSIVFENSGAPAKNAEDMFSSLGNMPSPILITLRMEVATISASLAAIDDVPIWKVFEVSKEEQLGSAHPLDPPKEIRYICMDKALDFFRSSKSMDLINDLYEAYKNNLDEKEVKKQNIALTVDDKIAEEMEKTKENPSQPPST